MSESKKFWEHTNIEVEHEEACKSSNFTSAINKIMSEYDNEGWQLVSACANLPRDGYRLFFKRMVAPF
jgi:hypothetical protein